MTMPFEVQCKAGAAMQTVGGHVLPFAELPYTVVS
jgi:nitrous oxide reductase accessory protein NosL